MDKSIKRRENISPLNIVFNQTSSEYVLYYSDLSNNTIVSQNIPSEVVSRDALVNMNRRFKNIKFMGLPSLIEFCKNEKLLMLQIVFEWINFFIYKVRFSFD